MTDIRVLIDYCEKNDVEYLLDEPLKNHCTFKIGGPASVLLRPATACAVGDLLHLSKESCVRAMVLGGGANVLFSDAGFDGAVVQLGRQFSKIWLLDDVTVEVQSGATVMQLCKFALDHSLSGLEFAYGIPGTVGGAVYMNAGAYGGEMKDVLVRSEHVDADGNAGCFQGEEMNLSYRHSAYTDGDLVITGAVFRLRPGDPGEIRAGMNDVMGRRRDKQPLEYPSAGSTFRRPEGSYASALIDRCGLKGRRVGGAVVSEKHAGFVVNDAGATCADVVELIRVIQEEVLAQTGYALDCEVKIIE